MLGDWKWAKIRCRVLVYGHGISTGSFKLFLQRGKRTPARARVPIDDSAAARKPARLRGTRGKETAHLLLLLPYSARALIYDKDAAL